MTLFPAMKVVLLAVLLVLAAWADTAQAQKALRLCGREFFRAVVYTCGGSRWRRGQNEDPLNGQYIFLLCLISLHPNVSESRKQTPKFLVVVITVTTPTTDILDSVSNLLYVLKF